MAEIEVGEYVRTNKGLITKITDIEIEKHEDGTSEIFIETELNYGYLDYTIEDIVKHSKQLIDLIEIGDYVNGEVITDKWDSRISSIKSNFCAEDIKTILTKESYIANCYKVGGEDE